MSYGLYDHSYQCGGYPAHHRLRMYGYAPYSRPPPPPLPMPDDPYSIYPTRVPMYGASIYVGNAGDAVPQHQGASTPAGKAPLPEVAVNGRVGAAAPAAAVAGPPRPRKSYTGHVVLSVFVILLFGNPLFGLAALVLALVAASVEASDARAAYRLGKSSIILSIVGIIVSIIAAATTVAVIFIPHAIHTTTPAPGGSG